VIHWGISAVRERRANAALLAETIRRETFDDEVIVYYDDPPSGCAWPNYRAALERAADVGCENDWLVVLEDDAQIKAPISAFARALDACPSPFASFFFSASEPLKLARAAGATWLVTVKVVHGVAWAIRTDLATELLNYASKNVPKTYLQNDAILLGWLLATKRSNYVTIPNLIEHHPEMVSVFAGERGRPNTDRSSGMLPTPGAPLSFTREWFCRDTPHDLERTVSRLVASGLRIF
jgi:hypothetical protein